MKILFDLKAKNMKMGKTEKAWINRKRHALANIKLLQRLFKTIDINGIENVLEVGCGIGIVSKYLYKEHSMNVSAIDVDDKQIQIAKEINKEFDRLKYQTASATDLPFEDNQFELVFSQGVFHHIGRWQKGLEEVNRVLKSGGYYIFSDIGYSKFMAGIFRRITDKYGIYTFDEIIDFFMARNFKLVHEEDTIGHIMKFRSFIFQKSQADTDHSES